MEPKYIERLIGKYCKVVIRAPGEKRGSVKIGFLENVNYLDNSVTIELKQGSDTVHIDNIIAIRSV